MIWICYSFAALAFICYAIQLFGNLQFNSQVRKEIESLFGNIDFTDNDIITAKDLEHLPEPVKRYLLKSGIIGKEKVKTVRLKQTARIRMKPDSRWFSHTTEQYFNAENPAFIWYANMPLITGLCMKVRDRFFKGQGEMLGKVLSVFPVLRATGEKINQGALSRFAGEMTWFPSAFLYDYCKWEAIDDFSARLRMNINGVDVNGIFTFDENYNLKTFECPRWMNEKDSEMKTYMNYFGSVNNPGGLNIPVAGQAVWKLDEGEFVYWDGQITEIEYNTNDQY